MKLTNITLENFRQFKGRQTFPLRGDSGKPVTLIFGANGAGKTTLLNAFIWALYGQLTEDVEVRDRLITDVVWRRAAAGEQVPLAVEIEFDHNGSSYRVRRSAVVRKEADEQPAIAGDVEAWVTDEVGASSQIGTPQPTIESILPHKMSRFFFFNGERIEKLAQKGAYADVKKDVRALLGLTQVERALLHLPTVERKLAAALRKHGGEKAAEIQKRIEDLEDARDQAEQRLEVLREDLKQIEAEADGVRDLLRQHQEARPLQEERERLAAELIRTRAAREKAVQDKKLLLATRGFLAFVGPLADQTATIAKNLYEKGALPAPLKRDFVDSLMTDQACICGTPLHEGSDPWRRVHEWRMKAGLAEVEAAWQQLEGQLSQLSGTRSDLRSQVAQAIDLIDSQSESVRTLEERLQDLDLKMGKLPLEEVRNLNAKLADLETRVADRHRKIGAEDSRLVETRGELAREITALEKAEVVDKSAALARERIAMVRRVHSALQEILAIREREMRSKLEKEVREVFAGITTRPFVPVLDENFELGLFQEVDGRLVPVAKSTGENQILSLSFVAAVSTVARQSRGAWHAEEDLGADWGQYPIVMDAAFGSLDQNYQRDVSQALARLAPQLVVLVSKSQGLGQVLGELRVHTNHIGVIVTHSTNTSRASEGIDILGTTSPYIETAADKDWAELKVVD